VEAVGHELVLQVVEVVLKLADELVEGLRVSGELAEVFAQILVEVHLFALGDNRLSVKGLYGGVFDLVVVEGGLREICEVAVEATGHYRRRKVGDHHGVAPPLRLGPFGYVVDDVGVDDRKVLNQYPRPAVVSRDSDLLAGGPLLGPVFSEVDDKVGIVPLPEPEVEGDVLVVGRDVLIVVEDGAVLKPASRRLGG
jgi:hypothetical protein